MPLPSAAAICALGPASAPEPTRQRTPEGGARLQIVADLAFSAVVTQPDEPCRGPRCGRQRRATVGSPVNFCIFRREHSRGFQFYVQCSEPL
jgi:hypothetical protein